MLGVSLCALLVTHSLADEAPPTEEPTDEHIVAQARQLISQLGSANFRQRELATEQLAELGWRARPALEEGLKDPQPETRLRVQRVLSLIREDDFQRAITSLLEDEQGAGDHPLPLWATYRETIGADRAARELFVAMLRADGGLLAEVAASPRSAAGQLQRRCEQLQLESGAQDREINVGSLAAVLFVAIDARVPLAVGTDSLLYRFCSHSGVTKALDSPDTGSPMRRVIGNWVQSGRGGYYSLRLAMAYDMPEGLAAAEKVLDSKSEAYYRQYAILTFAKLGTRADVPKLEKLLRDATICSTHTVDDVTYITQFRDIALVAVLHLHEEDPTKFGFVNIRTHPQYAYSPYTIGFASEEDRQAAFAKWDSYRNKRTPSDVAPPGEQGSE
jgi:hypothetical protein